MKKLILIFLIAMLPMIASATCIRGKHVPGTSGDSAFCSALYAKERTENAGSQSGNSGTIINLDTGPSSTEQAEQSAMVHGLPIANHYVSIEWSGYHFPGWQTMDSRQMPDPILMPTGIGWTWWMSKNLGFGALYQQFILAGTKSFDPITERRTVTETVDIIDDEGNPGTATREEERDVPVSWPGSVERVEVQRLLYYMAFNFALGESNQWNVSAKLGSDFYNNYRIKYSDVNLDDENSQYASQPEDRDITGKGLVFWEIAIERWYEGTRLSAYVRVVEGDNQAEDYMDYVDTGGIELGLSASFAIPALGYL
jgi:hypothetical protein